MNIIYNDLNDRNIDIEISECVTIHLYKKEYDELVSKLQPSMESEFKQALDYNKKATKRFKECRSFLDDLRQCFYDTSCGEFCIRKDMNEINEQEIFDLLDKYHELLGFY